MNLFEIIRFAFRGLSINKLRTSLTTMGIMIGVMSVIVLIAVGNGSSKAVQDSLDRLGTNSIQIRSGGGFFGGGGIQGAATRIKAFPHQFSGGMRQRVMIAMALVNNPSLLIADEPTTALDVTVQAQIIKLLGDLQKEFKMAMILITHDMGVVAGAADRVNVMYAGRIVESANVRDLYSNPLMPYTQGLLASVPRMDRPHTNRLSAITGQPPSMIALPTGCSFNPRCTRKSEVSGSRCETLMPDLTPRGNGHLARCFIGEGA